MIPGATLSRNPPTRPDFNYPLTSHFSKLFITFLVPLVPTLGWPSSKNRPRPDDDRRLAQVALFSVKNTFPFVWRRMAGVTKSRAFWYLLTHAFTQQRCKLEFSKQPEKGVITVEEGARKGGTALSPERRGSIQLYSHVL